MDKQKQIEEMSKDFTRFEITTKQGISVFAEKLYDLGYRKIPENAVVIPKTITEDTDSETLLAIANYNEGVRKVARKETAEKFAERLKEKAWAFNTDENGNVWDYSIMKSSIDEICKEITGVKV